MIPPRTIETPPQLYARLGGVLYLLIFALGFTLFAYPHISPAGGNQSLAHDIVAGEPRLRLASAGELFMYLCDVPLAVILYVLLKPVDRNLALLAAFFRLANAFVGGIAVLGRLAVLLLFGNPDYRAAFTQDQIQGLASLALGLHGYGVDIGIVFFSFHCILLGYLIFRSGYLPKFLGVLLPIAGLCYLTESFADIAAPAFSAALPIAILLPGFIAELSLCLWLLVKGVDVPKWQQIQTNAAR